MVSLENSSSAMAFCVFFVSALCSQFANDCQSKMGKILPPNTVSLAAFLFLLLFGQSISLKAKFRLRRGIKTQSFLSSNQIISILRILLARN